MDNYTDGYLRLLHEAEPFTDTAPERTSGARPRSSSSGDRPADVARALGAIRYLIAEGRLELGDYDSWCRLAIALKHSFQDDVGFAAFVELSSDAANFEGEEACRKLWQGIQEPEGKPLTVASYIAEATSAGWKSAEPAAAGERPTSAIPRGMDAASFTVVLAEDAGDEFWVDLEGKPHVTFKVTLPDGSEVVRHSTVTGPTYRQILEGRFHRAAVTKVLTSDQAALAVRLLEFRAVESGDVHTAALRVGQEAEKIYVDLGTPTGEAIEVDSEGWRVVREMPVRFVRGSRGPMTMPVKGGKLALFRKHFNVSDPDLKRVLGFMIGVFNTSGSFAILLTDGQQGSGKSNLNDKILALVDPPRQAKSARMSFNPKEQDLHLGALGVHVLYFDNVSTFSADAADALCRMSTGGASGSRKLYTNDEFNQVVVTRPLIITCIGSPTARPDLLSRSIQITALPLDGQRRTEKAVMRAFDADRGKMFGFILDCVAAALRHRAEIEDAVEQGEINLPRMADFAEFVEGAAELLELDRGGFSRLIEEGQSRVQAESVLGTPLGAALIAHFNESPDEELTGSATQILEALRPDNLKGYWPKPNALKKVLNRMAVGLRGYGIQWEITEPQGRDNVTKFRFWAGPTFRVETTTPDPF